MKPQLTFYSKVVNMRNHALIIHFTSHSNLFKLVNARLPDVSTDIENVFSSSRSSNKNYICVKNDLYQIEPAMFLPRHFEKQRSFAYLPVNRLPLDRTFPYIT